jgi:hypothetical protein
MQATMPITRERTQSQALDGAAWGILVVATASLVLLWLANQARVPWEDSGGYENMLRYFLATGRVDYMRWSQPTFTGLLPIAAPWGRLFGTSTGSLQLLSVGYAMLLVLGLYLFLLRHLAPRLAAILALMPLCFPDFVAGASTFMTDVPYACYMVWFLVVHQKLEDVEYSFNQSRQQYVLRAGWVLFFALAVLTRSFLLIFVPFFLIQAVVGTAETKPFARRCFVLSAVTGILCLIAVRLLGRNGFSLVELTVAREVLVQHEWARFDMRAFCLILLSTLVLALPALMLCRVAISRKLRAPEIAAGLLSLLVAAYFGRKGLLDPVLALPGVPMSARWVLILQILVLTPVATVLLGRVVQTVARKSSNSTSQLLVAIIVTHFAILPVMQHPLPRHVFPAFLCLLMAVALIGVSEKRNLALTAVIFGSMIAIQNVAFIHSNRMVNAARWNLSQSLVARGISPQAIDGGWGWFCACQLQPGSPNPQNYVTRYHEFVRTARYVVTPDTPDAGTSSAKLLRSVQVPSLNGVTTISALDRGSTP